MRDFKKTPPEEAAHVAMLGRSLSSKWCVEACYCFLGKVRFNLETGAVENRRVDSVSHFR